MLSLGVDVSFRRGFDLVCLDESRRLVEAPRRRQTLDNLRSVLETFRPDAVAIDSPPSFGTKGNSPKAEEELRRLGIQVFGTPSDPRQQRKPFYDWMREGQKAFTVAGLAGYPLYLGRGPVRKYPIEVFPHASAVVLKGILPPTGTSHRSLRREWRQGVLKAQGVETERLSSLDQIDAALAAFTGLMALEGICVALGDPAEGVIILPARSLPRRFMWTVK